MTRREKLQEAYEDALFALLMEDVIEEEGQRLADKNARLNANPDAAIPPTLDERCRTTIRRKHGQRRRRETGLQLGRITYRAFSKVAVVVVICMLLFTAAYAVSPDLRVKTLNLLIEVSDVKTTLSMGSTAEPEPANDTSAAVQAVYERFGYRIPELPDGMVLVKSSVSDSIAVLRYENEKGSSVIFFFATTDGGEYNIDTEDAQRVEHISIDDFEGLLSEKGERIQVVWNDSPRCVFINVTFVAISEDLARTIIDDMVP